MSARLWRLSRKVQNLSADWVVLTALGLFAFFLVGVLPAQAARTTDSDPTVIPDLYLFYSGDDLYEMAEALGQAGRPAHIRGRVTFDLIWPIVYTVFLASTLSWLTQRGFPDDAPWQLANLAPLAAALCDYLENGATSLVMARYPALTPVVADLAGVFTLSKWLFVGISAALALISLIAWGMRRAGITRT
jgi:hypothetical protein